MTLAVVIPFLDEADALPATLSALFRAIDTLEAVEVIAVDGGSRDASRTVIAAYPSIRVLDAPRGRALQMNAGAATTKADVLVFLHADCCLPDNALRALIAAVESGAQWGRFDVEIEGRSKLLPIVSRLMNLRSRATGIATGDQAIFVSRDAFNEVGGFSAVPLMEDIALSKALLRSIGRPRCLRDRVVASGRRWDTQGAWRTIFLMWRLRLDYWRGADTAAIARRYHRFARSRSPVLQIFAKDPQPGSVKTRLARSMGKHAAAELYCDLVESTLQTAAAARTNGIVSAIELWCDPDERRPAFVEWRDRYSVVLKSQRGNDLGERMRRALSAALADGAPAILIGTDSPALDTAYLSRAAKALADRDVVIGPAEDGGYVLVALSRDIDIFSGVPWSTAGVMAETRAKIAAARATYCELETLWDVDTPADAARFKSLGKRPMRPAFPWRPPPAESGPRARRS